jgi:hypothetical protein
LAAMGTRPIGFLWIGSQSIITVVSHWSRFQCGGEPPLATSHEPPTTASKRRISPTESDNFRRWSKRRVSPEKGRLGEQFQGDRGCRSSGHYAGTQEIRFVSLLSLCSFLGNAGLPGKEQPSEESLGGRIRPQ